MKKYLLYLIVANEFCERYCFYALKSVLFAFLRTEYGLSSKQTTFAVHLFVSMCYFCTLIGGFLSDMVLGKYRTILCLSIVYYFGTAFLTYSSYIYTSPYMLYYGLGLIALGTGGIKPCVAAFGGDQIQSGAGEQELVRFFSFFYFAINLGSMLSTFIVPILADISCNGRSSCYPLAFGSSSTLLAISIFFFVVGSNMYVKKKADNQAIKQFARRLKLTIKHAFTGHDKMLNRTSAPDTTITEYKAQHSTTQDRIGNDTGIDVSDNINVHDESVNKDCDEYKNNVDDKPHCIEKCRIFVLFIPIAFFWMMYDQQSSSWIEQGLKMNNKSVLFAKSFQILSSQMQTFNSLFILCFIPLFSSVIYPFFEYLGLYLTPIKKMAAGILLASLSFLMAATCEHYIYMYNLEGQKISILWQIPQYAVLTAGEIMLNMTGLEFAYSEAPIDMKTLIQSGWLLTVTFGNIFVVLYTMIDIKKFITHKEVETCNFLIYAGIGSVAAIWMYKLERWYIRGK